MLRRITFPLSLFLLIAGTVRAQVPYQFQPQTIGGSGASPSLGDLNGDGILDLINHSSSTGVYTALGIGGGVFGPLTTMVLAPNVKLVTRNALGDFDSDGRLDVVAGATGNLIGLVFLKGDGAGSLALPIQAGPVENPIANDPIPTCDFNLDGNLDAVMRSQSGYTVSLLPGMGNGTFGPPAVVETVNPPTSGLHQTLTLGAVSDIDNNGLMDLTIDYYYHSTTTIPGVGTLGINYVDLRFYSGTQGGGLAQSGSQSLEYAVYPTKVQSSVKVALRDVDGDGLMDIAVHSGKIATVRRLRALQSTGAFNYSTVAELFLPNSVLDFYTLKRLEWIDVDGNSSPELVVLNSQAGVEFYRLLSGSLSLISTSPLSLMGSLLTGDYNADGREDLIVSSVDVSIPGQSPSMLYRGIHTDPQPVGIQPFGMGTPACGKVEPLSAKSSATVGNNNFTLTLKNGPRNAQGSLVMAAQGVDPGFDVFGINLVIHVDFFGAPVAEFLIQTDGLGYAEVSLAIPSIPALQGVSAAFQSFWQSNPCQSFGLSSSRGVMVTIQ